MMHDAKCMMIITLDGKKNESEICLPFLGGIPFDFSVMIYNNLNISANNKMLYIS